MRPPPERRVAALVLPDLACELVRQRARAPGPLGVLFEREGEAHRGDSLEVKANATLDAADAQARRYGVRAGQRVTEAAALVSGLAVHRVTYEELDAALGRVAEVTLALGTTAAVRLEDAGAGSARGPWSDAPLDTVWLDVTGAAHLVGGEAALLDELTSRIGALGHQVRAAVASGPRIAAAIARWSAATSRGAGVVVTAGDEVRAVSELPVQALPIDPETASWLVRLGVLLVGDLARLPRAEASARLGARARIAMDLAAGRDSAPLVPYAPPRIITEDTSFEDGVDHTEALLFVLRGMTSRASARLTARGEACTRIEVTLRYDRSIARLRLAETATRTGTPTPGDDACKALDFAVDLPAPLAREADLLRALKARLERTELLAPVTGVRLVLPQITQASRVQLDLSRDVAVDPDNLPALLAELSAEIGPSRVGVLAISDAHRPEARSKLVPALEARGKAPVDAPPWAPAEPTRLLTEPVPIGRLQRGAVVAVNRQLYAIERVRFVMRLDAVEWWTPSPVSRDYVSVWLASGGPRREESGVTRLRSLSGGSGPGAEAWVYVDRTTGEAYLQGFCE